MTEPKNHLRPDERVFVGSGVADAATASQLRRGFADWLDQRFALGQSRLSDAVLAVYEALANAAEFAYVGAPTAGTLLLEAHHDSTDNRLSVRIRDHGTWRETVPALRDNTRGRGIPLMKALADRATIEPSPSGTAVLLEFDNVRADDGEALAASA